MILYLPSETDGGLMPEPLGFNTPGYAERYFEMVKQYSVEVRHAPSRLVGLTVAHLIPTSNGSSGWRLHGRETLIPPLRSAARSSAPAAR